MKNNIKRFLKSDLFKVVALVLSVILGGWLIMYPEEVTDKTVVLVGVLISVSEIRQFMKWVTEDDVNDIEVKEVEVLHREDEVLNAIKATNEYDGGDDFSKFKAENGIED